VTIFLVSLSGYAIQSEDEDIQSGIDQMVDVLLILKKMAVGAADHFETLVFRISYHGKEILVDKRLSPAPQMKKKQMITHLIDQFLELFQAQ
jgi:hypothetical protein